MVNRDKRDALRGAETEIIDILAEVLTSEAWATLLKAPLQLAVANGSRGLAQKLVGAGAQIGDALHAAVRLDHKGIVNDMLESGVPVAAKGTGVWTPFHVAAQLGKEDMVKAFLRNGADKDALDNQQRTPLFLATEDGNVAAALALMAAGADVGISCGLFKTPVMNVAARWSYMEILRALIGYGADLEAADEPNGRKALHCAAIQDAVEAIDVLVEAGANIDASNYTGCTPLHYAATHLHPAALSALLAHGADVNARDEKVQTPLYFAAREAGTQGAAEVVDLLLRSDADETILNDEGEAAADVVGAIRTFERDKSPRMLISCISYWQALRPTEHGVAGATWRCAALTPIGCSWYRKKAARLLGWNGGLVVPVSW